MREGLAREFVRRVQDLRKQAELDIADRISLVYNATPGLAGAITAHREYIMNETLAVEMTPSLLPAGVATITAEFDGEKVTLGLQRS